MTAPTLYCVVDPAPSPCKSDPMMRSSPSAASRPAQQRTPSLAAGVAAQIAASQAALCPPPLGPLWRRVPPFKPLYDGPYAVLHLGPCSFAMRDGSRDEIIAVGRLKACTAAWQPAWLRPTAWPAPKWSRWFLLLPLQRRLEMVLEPFSYLARRFLHARDRQRLHGLHRSGTRDVNEHHHGG
jgi:hypothetical protein